MDKICPSCKAVNNADAQTCTTCKYPLYDAITSQNYEDSERNIAKGVKIFGVFVMIIGFLLGLTASFVEVEKAYGSETVFIWSAFLPYLLQSFIGGSIVLAIGYVIEALSEILNKIEKL